MDTLSGFRHTIAAQNQAVGSVNYGFISWSDGGAQTHEVNAAETGESYLATFQSSTVTAFPTSATVSDGDALERHRLGAGQR